MADTIMIIAAHPDDEVLGCGGTIARHVEQGDAVHVAWMTDGVGARGESAGRARAEREAARDKAIGILGVASSHAFDFPDNRMDHVSLLDIVKPLEGLMADIRPSTLYTHHHGDLNIDHRITYQAALTACRPYPGQLVREILAFEVMSSTEWFVEGKAFDPDVFVDISDHWPKKEAAMHAYRPEMRPSPHSRSVEHLDVLSRHRGMGMGMVRAEAFVLIRSLR